MALESVNWRARGFRRLGSGLSACALLLQVGCYTYLPVQTSAPATGTRIAVVLNDRGRVELSDRLGSAIDRVDGLLVTTDATSVTLEVYRTLDLRGGTATWTGERIQMPRDGLSGFQERQFSRRRTILLTAAIVGAITVSMLAVKFDLFGGFTRDEPGSSQTGDSR